MKEKSEKVFYEEMREVKGYEDKYLITKSGRVISLNEMRPRYGGGGEYGFYTVKLSKDGEGVEVNLFNLWKEHFPELSESYFKGKRYR